MYFFITFSSAVILKIFFKINVSGIENIPKKGRFILAANHQNFIDGFFLADLTSPFKKVSFVIAKRALKSKLSHLMFKSIGSVLIGNEIEEYQMALKKLNRILNHGGMVGIFPEGDISNKDLPKKFKGGVAKLSLDSKSRVIPIYLQGTYNLRYLKNSIRFKRPEI